MRKSIIALALVAAHCGVALAADWGMFGPYVAPTTADQHNGIGDIATETRALFGTPEWGGQPGATTLGGVPVSSLANAPETVGFDGLTSQDGTGIALAEKFGQIGANFSMEQKVDFAAATYHEFAHKEYTSFFSSWCSSIPTVCDNYKQCAKNDGYDFESGYMPCDEAHAFGQEIAGLCADKASICQNGDLTQEEIDEASAEIDKKVDESFTQCEGHTNNCTFCGGPLPPGSPGCGSGTCPSC